MGPFKDLAQPRRARSHYGALAEKNRAGMSSRKGGTGRGSQRSSGNQEKGFKKNSGGQSFKERRAHEGK